MGCTVQRGGPSHAKELFSVLLSPETHAVPLSADRDFQKAPTLGAEPGRLGHRLLTELPSLGSGESMVVSEIMFGPLKVYKHTTEKKLYGQASAWSSSQKMTTKLHT